MIHGTTARILIFLLTLFSFCLSMYGQEVEIQSSGQIKNVKDPVDPQDAATKNYVDQMSEILLNAGINGVVQDIDGNVYKTIKIGTQVWMAENLKATHYNDGDAVPNITVDSEWDDLASGAYCTYSNDNNNDVNYWCVYTVCVTQAPVHLATPLYSRPASVARPSILVSNIS